MTSYDALVVGTPSERWGQQVTAVVRVRDGEEADEEGHRETVREELQAEAAERREILLDAISMFDDELAMLFLEGEDIGLEGSTPLIEWGIVNSLEISRLVAFISDRYGVAIPNDQIVLENFENLESNTRHQLTR